MYEAAGAADAIACSRDGFILSYKICVLSAALVIVLLAIIIIRVRWVVRTLKGPVRWR